MEAYNCEADSFNVALDSQNAFLQSIMNVESELHKEQQVQIHNSATGREGKGREGKGREGKGREGKGRGWKERGGEGRKGKGRRR